MAEAVMITDPKVIQLLGGNQASVCNDPNFYHHCGQILWESHKLHVDKKGRLTPETTIG